MSFTKESATTKAIHDLAERLKIDDSEIETISTEDTDFPDMSLGAPAEDEMSAQMISSGWVIILGVNDKKYEYRADKYQLRLVDFDETNHVIVS